MLLQNFFPYIQPQVFPFPFDANSEFVSTFNKSDVLLELTQFHRLFFYSIYFWTARPYLLFYFGTFDSFLAGLGRNQVYGACTNDQYTSLNQFSKAANWYQELTVLIYKLCSQDCFLLLSAQSLPIRVYYPHFIFPEKNPKVDSSYRYVFVF